MLLPEGVANIAEGRGGNGGAKVATAWSLVKAVTGGGGLQVGVLRTVWVRMLYFDFRSCLDFWVSNCDIGDESDLVEAGEGIAVDQRRCAR
jgi:hypothetical protein